MVRERTIGYNKSKSTGAVQWAKTYGGSNWDLYPGAIQTSDGGFAIFGSTQSFGSGGSDFMIIKTNAYGNPQWAKTYGGTADDGSYGINQTSDGGFVFAGGTWSFGAGGQDVFFVRTDANGNIGSCPIVRSVSPSVTSPYINVTNNKRLNIFADHQCIKCFLLRFIANFNGKYHMLLFFHI